METATRPPNPDFAAATRLFRAALVVATFALVTAPLGAAAQCPPEAPLQNYDGGASAVCPCFVPGEEAGVILDAPASHYPLEILRIVIGWGSQFGGSPQQLEEAIRVYDAGLPNPGLPIFELPGPQLTDGFLNEFDIEPLPGEVILDSGPFTVSLRFLNSNSGDIFAPSVLHDANGCQLGKNVVYAVPGGWNDACLLGVTGDWVMYVVYRPCVPTAADDGPFIASSVPAKIISASPNPFTAYSELRFLLATEGNARVTVYAVTGQRVSELVDSDYPAGVHEVVWDAHDDNGRPMPSGVYFVELIAGEHRSVKKIHLTK